MRSTHLQVNGTSVTLTATADVGSTFTGERGLHGRVRGDDVGVSFCDRDVQRHPTPTYQTTFYHHDTVGSVRAITDAAGQPIVTHTYAPFGEDPSPTTGDPKRFTGQELDPGTALQVPRYYRSTIGRFMSVDPGQVGAHLPRPQTWNAYSYGLNAPLRFVDRHGLDPEDAGDLEIPIPPCSEVCQEDSLAPRIVRETVSGGGGGGPRNTAVVTVSTHFENEQGRIMLPQVWVYVRNGIMQAAGINLPGNHR